MQSVFQHLEARYVFHITYHPGHEKAQELIGFLKDVTSCSDKLSCRMSETEKPVLEFTLLKDDVETGIKFRSIPGGHEFTSLLLAVLNVDGKGKLNRQGAHVKDWQASVPESDFLPSHTSQS